MASKKKSSSRKLPNVPWVTKDGQVDLSKYPIESVLQQGLDEDDRLFDSACYILTSMYSAGREEAAICLYGFFQKCRGNQRRQETVVDALGKIKTKVGADLLFDELEKTESSNQTRSYINVILQALSHFPAEIVAGRFSDLVDDKRWSHRMRAKFREILENLERRRG